MPKKNSIIKYQIAIILKYPEGLRLSCRENHVLHNSNLFKTLLPLSTSSMVQMICSEQYMLCLLTLKTRLLQNQKQKQRCREPFNPPFFVYLNCKQMLAFLFVCFCFNLEIKNILHLGIWNSQFNQIIRLNLKTSWRTLSVVGI